MFDPAMPIGDVVREANAAFADFSAGRRIGLRAQVFCMYAEALSLTSEYDAEHGTRNLCEKFGFARHKPELYRAEFCEMSLAAGARVLVVDLRMIGDSVHVGEMCAALKCRFPGAHVTYLSLSGAGAVVSACGAVDAVIDYSQREYVEDVRVREHAGGLLPSIARTLTRVNKNRFDAVINVNPSLLAMLFLYRLEGKPTVYGWRFDEYNRSVFRGNLFHYLFGVNRRVHLAEQMVRFLPPAPSFVSDAALFRPVPHDLVPRGAVGIFPGARIATHRWPKEYWAELIKAVRTSLGCPVVIFGGAKEHDIAEEIIGLCGSGGVVDACGKIPLSSLGSAMAGLSAIVSNDSGGKHVAVAGLVPSVEISGSGIPLDQCGPYGARGLVLQADLDCLNCEGFVCEHCNCMKHVRPEAAFAALRALLFTGDQGSPATLMTFATVFAQPMFEGLSVWWSGIKRPGIGFAYQPIRTTYHPVRSRNRLWSFAQDVICAEKNRSLGCADHGLRLSSATVAAYLRGFSSCDRTKLVGDAEDIARQFLAMRDIDLRTDVTVPERIGLYETTAQDEMRFFVTLNSRLADMMTSHGETGSAAVLFCRMMHDDLAAGTSVWERLSSIVRRGV